MTSFYRRLLQRLAFSESRHFSWDIDPANTMVRRLTAGPSYKGMIIAKASEAEKPYKKDRMKYLDASQLEKMTASDGAPFDAYNFLGNLSHTLCSMADICCFPCKYEKSFPIVTLSFITLPKRPTCVEFTSRPKRVTPCHRPWYIGGILIPVKWHDLLKASCWSKR